MRHIMNRLIVESGRCISGRPYKDDKIDTDLTELNNRPAGRGGRGPTPASRLVWSLFHRLPVDIRFAGGT